MEPILYWNDVALEANRVSHTNGKGEQTGPPLSSRALAIVHLAMHDAYFGIETTCGHQPYLPGLPPPSAGASAAAAIAAAAHATLSQLFPSQKAFFDSRHAQAGLSDPGAQAGHQFGLQVAAAMLAERQGDPGVGDNGYAFSMARGAHRADPEHPDQGYHAPFYGARSKCFAAQVRHGLDQPPALNDATYLKALKEVRGKGIAPHLIGTLPPGIAPRTADETVVGVYWGYDGAMGLGTPPRLYNQIIRKVAEKRANNTAANARLFALVNVAMADAGILAWEQKYIYDLWRPVVGIREQDESMGPTGSGTDDVVSDCDPFWLPLGAPATNSTNRNFTPNFPSYPSGHATFGAAALHMARLFYGKPAGDRGPDDLFAGLSFVSDELNGVNRDNAGTVRPRHARTFSRGLWQMIEENGRSRVNLGVHWVFDAFAVDKSGQPDLTKNIGGAPLGLNIAEDIFASGMKKSPAKPLGCAQSAAATS